MAAIVQPIFEVHFLLWKLYFDPNFNEIYF